MSCLWQTAQAALQSAAKVGPIFQWHVRLLVRRAPYISQSRRAQLTGSVKVHQESCAASLQLCSRLCGVCCAASSRHEDDDIRMGSLSVPGGGLSLSALSLLQNVADAALTICRLTLHKAGALPKHLQQLDYALVETTEAWIIEGLQYADYLRELPSPQVLHGNKLLEAVSRAVRLDAWLSNL